MIEATPSEVYAPCGDPWTPPTSGRGDSISAIARVCGLSAGHVSRVFRGERRPGDTPAGRKLARLLAAHSVRDRAFFSAGIDGGRTIRSMRRSVNRAAETDVDFLRDIAPIAIFGDMPFPIRLLPAREKAKMRALVDGIGLYLRTGGLHDSAFIASERSVRRGGPRITDSSLLRAVSAWKRGGIDALIDRRKLARILSRRNPAAAK